MTGVAPSGANDLSIYVKSRGGSPWLPYGAPSGLPFFLLLLLLILPTPTHPLGEFTPATARSAGMGDAYVGLASGAEAVAWNPGGVPMGARVSTAIGYDQPFQMRVLEQATGLAAVTIGRIGVGVLRRDSRVPGVTESTSGAVVGVRVGRVGVGIGVRAVRFGTAGRSPRSWVAFDLGLHAAGETVRVGMTGRNVTGNAIDVLSQGGAIGVAVSWGPTTVTVDVQKEAGTETGGGVGLERAVSRSGWIRFGIGGYPERLTLGVGVRRGGLSFDYGILYHTILGFSHRASLGFGR